MADYLDREQLYDTIHTQGWEVVVSIVEGRMGRIREVLETCTKDELDGWQSRLDELKVFKANIDKELFKHKKGEHDDEDDTEEPI